MKTDKLTNTVKKKQKKTYIYQKKENLEMDDVNFIGQKDGQ